MQIPTHLVTGLLIDQAVPDNMPGFFRRTTIAFLSLFSHVILDALAALTYHPPDPSPEDRFWLGYHAGLVALSLRVWLNNRRQHKWAMIWTVLPDLDWVIIKIPKVFGFQTAAIRRPVLHELLFSTLYWLPPGRLLKGLPNLRQKKATAILECILLILLSGIRILASSRGENGRG